jgi:hypothetical protein
MAKNEAIGTVECPVKGCTEQCSVFRFRERGDSEKSVANRRFAGKLYGRCTRHGRFGGDAGDDAMQEYIETNSKKITPAAGDGRPSPAKTPASAPAAPAARSARAPAKTPASSPAKAANGGWAWPWD